MPFSRLFEDLPHSPPQQTSGKIRRPDGDKPPKTVPPEGSRKGQETGQVQRQQLQTGTKTMARFEIQNSGYATMGGETRADTFCEMGLMYATGRGCAVDLVAAHKWLNIAAIKGSDRAAELRADLAQTMSKAELAAALRAAREWMTMH